MSEQPLKKINNDSDIIPIEIPTPFPIGNVNIYLILGEKITLVDTGPKTELAWKTLIYQLNKNGLRVKDIDQVLVTHHHVDHCGLLAILLEHHPKLKIMAHPLTVPWLEKRTEVFNQFLDFYEETYLKHGLSKERISSAKDFLHYFDKYHDPIIIDGVVNDGELIQGNANWQVIHNPGHTQGHISLYNSASQSLIAGDHLIGHISSGTFIEPPIKKGDERPRSMQDYIKSLERIKTLEVRQVFSGHGKIITNHQQIIEQQLKRFSERIDSIEDLLRVNSKQLSIYEIMKLVYPDRFEKHLPLYFSEVLGWLDLLEQQGKVSFTINEEKIFYHYQG